jgi:hypothetical protein
VTFGNTTPLEDVRFADSKGVDARRAASEMPAMANVIEVNVRNWFSK